MTPPPLPGNTWTPDAVLFLILGVLYGIGILYNIVGHRDNKAAVKAADDKANIAVTQSARALAAAPSPTQAVPAPQDAAQPTLVFPPVTEQATPVALSVGFVGIAPTPEPEEVNKSRTVYVPLTPGEVVTPPLVQNQAVTP